MATRKKKKRQVASRRTSAKRPRRRRQKSPAATPPQVDEIYAASFTSEPPRAATSFLGQGGLGADATVLRAPVSIIPTPYPNNPADPLVIASYLRIDVHGADFKELDAKLGALLSELSRTNQIAGEIRDQLAAELQAGRALLRAPKPDSNLLKVLLLHPLTFIATAAVGTIIGEYASAAFHALLRIFESSGIPL